MREVTNRAATAMHGSRPDFNKSRSRVEGVRDRIWWPYIYFTKHLRMPGLDRVFEQITIEPSRTAAASSRRCDHDPVHIHKSRIAAAKPLKVRTDVIGVLVQGQQKRVNLPNSPCPERLPDEIFELLWFQPGQLPRMCVVQFKQDLAQRRCPACGGASDGFQFVINHALRLSQRKTRASFRPSREQ